MAPMFEGKRLNYVPFNGSAYDLKVTNLEIQY